MKKRPGIALIVALSVVLAAMIVLIIVFVDKFAVIFPCFVVGIGAVIFISATVNEMKRYELMHKNGDKADDDGGDNSENRR